MALFSSRKTRSNSSGNPGHLRRDFLQLPHVGLFSSHCAQSVRDRAWLSSGADATRRDRTHQRTLILLLLHMPHPRLGLPVYTMLGVREEGEEWVVERSSHRNTVFGLCFPQREATAHEQIGANVCIKKTWALGLHSTRLSSGPRDAHYVAFLPQRAHATGPGSRISGTRGTRATRSAIESSGMRDPRGTGSERRRGCQRRGCELNGRDGEGSTETQKKRPSIR
jgi:hypothetical protein